MSLPVSSIRRRQHGVGLDRFLAGNRGERAELEAALGRTEQEQVVEAFIRLLDGLYAHLPLKRSMYGLDPIQRLRLLQQQLDASWLDADLTAVEFHSRLAAIITGLRDAHTRYVGPSFLEGRIAMLPFLVEAYGPWSAPRYIVSKMLQDPGSASSEPGPFREGVEIATWNAVPMDRAVNRHADEETGGRPDSRRVRALESMTLRALQFGPAPDELWVDIGYLDLDGRRQTERVTWRVVEPGSASTTGRGAGGEAGHRFAIDPVSEVHRHAKKLLFKPDVWYADATQTVPSPDGAADVADGEWIPTPMRDVLAAKVVPSRGRRLGYLRLWSFDVADDDAYLAEVVRILGLLPDRGLIIDLRANPGGLIWAAERMLQLFTPHPVAPNGFSLLSSALTRELANAGQNRPDFDPWTTSLRDAVSTGELYSAAVPITPPERCNDIGQVYGGPVVAIADPNTYSAGDLFAAGFVDNGIGRLVCVGAATGGGGANVWTARDVSRALLGTPHEIGELPAGIDYTMSVRRATRSGPAVGTSIEDVGVHGTETSYAMTHRDLTDSNGDLISHAAKVLLALPWTSMTATPPSAEGEPLTVRTRGVEMLDLLVDGAFRPSREVTGRTTRFELDGGWSTVEVHGRANGRLVQRRVLRAGG